MQGILTVDRTYKDSGTPAAVQVNSKDFTFAEKEFEFRMLHGIVVSMRQGLAGWVIRSPAS